MITRESFNKVGEERRAVIELVLKAIGPTTIYEAAKHYNTTRATTGRALDGEQQNSTKGRKPKAYTAQELREILEDEVTHRTADQYIELLNKLAPKIRAVLK